MLQIHPKKVKLKGEYDQEIPQSHTADQPMALKFVERKRRGTSETLLTSGPKTKAPMDWKISMANDEIKRCLLNFFLMNGRNSHIIYEQYIISQAQLQMQLM